MVLSWCPGWEPTKPFFLDLGLRGPSLRAQITEGNMGPVLRRGSPQLGRQLGALQTVE